MIKEALLKLRMRLTPPSSQSFHDSWKEIVEHLWCLDGKCDAQMRMLEDLTQKVYALSQQALANDIHAQLRWQELYRQPGETPEELKRRFFAAIPPATGSAREFQLANARLLSEFDAVCKRNDLDYWLCYGSLLAAVSRHGAIPWDDDVDICMTSDDVERLQVALAGDDRLQITVAYDYYPLCKQVRFSLRDDDIPCFIDVCPWDWARSASQNDDDRLRELRLSLMEDISQNEEDFECWKKYSVLYKPGSGQVVQWGGLFLPQPEADEAQRQIDVIESLFSKCESIAREEGILCDKAHAEGLAYGLRNIYDVPSRRIIFPRSMILPTTSVTYEGYEVQAPSDPEGVCDECFPGWPYLPNDIAGHNHMPENLLRNETILRAVSSYAEGDSGLSK